MKQKWSKAPEDITEEFNLLAQETRDDLSKATNQHTTKITKDFLQIVISKHHQPHNYTMCYQQSY